MTALQWPRRLTQLLLMALLIAHLGRCAPTPGFSWPKSFSWSRKQSPASTSVATQDSAITVDSISGSPNDDAFSYFPPFSDFTPDVLPVSVIPVDPTPVDHAKTDPLGSMGNTERGDSNVNSGPIPRNDAHGGVPILPDALPDASAVEGSSAHDPESKSASTSAEQSPANADRNSGGAVKHSSRSSFLSKIPVPAEKKGEKRTYRALNVKQYEGSAGIRNQLPSKVMSSSEGSPHVSPSRSDFSSNSFSRATSMSSIPVGSSGPNSNPPSAKRTSVDANAKVGRESKIPVRAGRRVSEGPNRASGNYAQPTAASKARQKPAPARSPKPLSRAGSTTSFEFTSATSSRGESLLGRPRWRIVGKIPSAV
ncbi:hypothetical protein CAUPRSCDRAFT_11814 [Caulochytrium protostelioides]|uniref:Uncharacterized protein n=1 Tax=Caulochytrium protostelioides TaxID=1555241 RepID=A0A4P9WV60_9FUNG|nr:hypothetical protein CAUPRSCDRAFT_11814 [Caulochytrium protostelioides]